MIYPNYKSETFRSLLALSVADAAGENEMKILPAAAYKAGNVALERGLVIEDHWPWTDDTHLAIGVTRTLFRYGTIIGRQIELAKEMSANFIADRMRGYGKGTHGLLTVFGYDAENCVELSRTWWVTNGVAGGSIGNGSAMRDAVIGAHFGHDLKHTAAQAEASAQVTHYSDPAIAGSIAVAIAAAIATYGHTSEFWAAILAHVPAGEMRNRIEWVSTEGQKLDNWGVVGQVGNGKNVLAIDTVPFALWQAYRVLTTGLSFTEGITSIVEVGGDTDTVAAIYGGIVGNRVRPFLTEIERTERLPNDLYEQNM